MVCVIFAGIGIALAAHFLSRNVLLAFLCTAIGTGLFPVLLGWDARGHIVPDAFAAFWPCAAMGWIVAALVWIPFAIFRRRDGRAAHGNSD